MKRKYTKSGERPSSYKCTNKKCKWEGAEEEKSEKYLREKGWIELVCPNCGNNEFFGLI